MASAYPDWIFDASPIADPLGHGERAVRFLKALKHPKSRLEGGTFSLDPWQERIVRRIYSPRHEDGSRIVKTVVLLLPRGNRKTSLAAALSLLHALGPERVPGGEVLTAAADRKQARLAFAEAVNIVRATAAADRASRIIDSRNRLVSIAHGSFLESVSSDAGVQHGKTPAFAFVDELHAHKKRDTWDVIRSGLIKTPGSLLIVATTAGRGAENIAAEIIGYARKVAAGDIDDPATLPILFETPASADWRDEAIWRRVNPGLAHGYPDIEGLRQMAREAEDRPGDRAAFCQLSLNMWQDTSASPFVEMSLYDEGAGAIDLEDLEGRPCWLGVDLSSSIDLSVIVAAFPGDDDSVTIVPWLFIPTGNIAERERVSGAPYRQWVKDGHVEATAGDVVDFRHVEDRIRELCQRFDVQEIAVDPALARNLLSNLADDGLPAVEHRQGALSMMPAIQALEVAILGRKLRHNANPAMRWCFSNVEVETNSHGHKVRLTKSKKWLSIDPVVAAAMAVNRAAAGSTGRSVYDSADTWQPDMAFF